MTQDEIILAKTAIDEQIAALRDKKRELAKLEREIVQADLAARRAARNPEDVQRAGI